LLASVWKKIILKGGVFVKKIIIVLLVVVTMILGGCSHRLNSGEVYNKEYTPAHTQTMIIPIVISNGKTSETILMPYIYYYPDTWTLKIKDFQDNKWITDEYYVSKDVYDAVSVGNEFKYDSNRGDLDSQPYIRTKTTETP
jgi:uncharacterized lipoprotein NlpE involved in copper resistance